MSRLPRLRVLLLCGGASEEHEVSLSSARSVLAALGDRHDVRVVAVGRDGRLLDEAASRRAVRDGRSDAPALSASAGLRGGSAEPAPPETAPPGPAPAGMAGGLVALAGSGGADVGFDVVLPVLHGPNGEDGTVQGMLRLMGLPFVGSGVLGSALGMDKIAMKRVFAAHGLPQVRFAGASRAAWRRDPDGVLAALDADGLPWPRFVKPANLGSSVGISRADDPAALRAALEEAFRFDRRVIVEEGVPGARELEVGVLGNDEPDVSPVGEIRFLGDGFYDYDTKYVEGRAELAIPADVPARVAERCRALAREAFLAVDAAGLARVDFFWDEAADRVLLNEINTMPGFTRTSMYPKLWEAGGVPYAELVERLLALALEPR